MNVRMPVKPAPVRMNGAEDTDIQSAQTGGIQQIIDSQAAEVVKQPAVDLKQRPQGIGQGKNQMLPAAVRQPVKLGGNPQIGGFFAAGRADTAVAGVGDVSDCRHPGVLQAYSFTPAMRVPQASILVTASTSISRIPPASRKEVQH